MGWGSHLVGILSLFGTKQQILITLCSTPNQAGFYSITISLTSQFEILPFLKQCHGMVNVAFFVFSHSVEETESLLRNAR